MAIVLNGIDQGINCGPSAPILAGGGSVFMYFEVTTDRAADETYLGLGIRPDSQRSIEIVGIAGGHLYQVLVPQGGGAQSSQAAAEIKDGAPHRVFVAWSQQSGRRFCYVDGVLRSQELMTVPSPAQPTDGETTLGYKNWTNEKRWHQGELANVAVWSGAYFGDQAGENAAAQNLTLGVSAVGDYPGFSAYWPLDYDARDLGPNQLHGTVVGAPAFTETSPRWIRGDGTPLVPYVKTPSGLRELQ